jgi:hypothetical protein
MFIYGTNIIHVYTNTTHDYNTTNIHINTLNDGHNKIKCISSAISFMHNMYHVMWLCCILNNAKKVNFTHRNCKYIRTYMYKIYMSMENQLLRRQYKFVPVQVIEGYSPVDR